MNKWLRWDRMGDVDSVTLIACVASIFGMNVPSGMEDNGWAFNQIVFGTLLAAMLAFLAFLAYTRLQQLL